MILVNLLILKISTKKLKPHWQNSLSRKNAEKQKNGILKKCAEVGMGAAPNIRDLKKTLPTPDNRDGGRIKQLAIIED